MLDSLTDQPILSPYSNKTVASIYTFLNTMGINDHGTPLVTVPIKVLHSRVKTDLPKKVFTVTCFIRSANRITELIVESM